VRPIQVRPLYEVRPQWCLERPWWFSVLNGGIGCQGLGAVLAFTPKLTQAANRSGFFAGFKPATRSSPIRNLVVTFRIGNPLNPT
jgi:hypothetical protein